MATLSFDLDSVLASFLENIIQIYNSRFNAVLTAEDFKHYAFADSFGQEVADRIVAIFHEPGFYKDLIPLPGALETVDELLARGHTIEIVTAPPSTHSPHAAGEKIEWVSKWFPALAKNVTVTKNKFYVATDMLIDDYAHNIEKWCKSNSSGLGFLVNQPWNKSYDYMPHNSVRGKITMLPDLIDYFYCPLRKVFGYRIDDLKSWNTF